MWENPIKKDSSEVRASDILELRAGIQLLRNKYLALKEGVRSKGCPIGAIVAVDTSSLTSVPTDGSWFICDGENGTVNLVDRFPLISSDTTLLFNVGGLSNVMLTVDENGEHNHSQGFAYWWQVHVYNGKNWKYGHDLNTGKGSCMTSTMVEKFENTTQTAHNNMPPYYSVVYMQKVR